jgi:branched-chain amino acid transport system permease protein
VLAVLFSLQWVLPPYHHTNLARVMVLAVFAMGYNIGFGYTGLLSLGHALFFGAGLYATGMLVQLGGWGAGPALTISFASTSLMMAASASNSAMSCSSDSWPKSIRACQGAGHRVA